MFNFFSKKRVLPGSNVKIYKPAPRTVQSSEGRKNIAKIVLALMMFGVIAFFFFSPYFKIYNIEFERDDISIDPTETLSALSNLKGKHIFLINLTGIEKDLQSQFAKFKNIKIYRRLPDKLVLKLESYQDAFLINSFFTKENKQTKLKEKYIQEFYISQSGEIKGNTKEGEKALDIIYLKEENKEFKPGDAALSPNMVAKIQGLIDKLKKRYGLKIIKIDLYTKGREIRIETEKGTLWITFSKKIDDQLDKIPLFDQNYGKDKKFNYVDLRVDGKIIYKE